MNPPAAVIFDVDGVLADTEPIIAEASIRMFHDLYGVTFRPEDFRPYIGTGSEPYIAGPAQLAGLTIDLPRALEVKHRYFEEMVTQGPCIAFDGAADLVRACAHEPNWRLAIATSSPEGKAMATLRATRLPLNCFSVIVHGDHVARKKPYPDIYLYTAEKLGIAADRCVVIEDSPAGIRAAKTAGMHCVGVASTFDTAHLTEADAVVPRLSEITVPLLRRLLGDSTEALRGFPRIRPEGP